MKPQFEIVISGDNDMFFAQRFIGKKFTLTMKRFPNGNGKIIVIADEDIEISIKEEEKSD